MGVPQWAQRGTKGSGQTVAMQDRAGIVKKQVTDSTDVAAGDTVDVDIFAPSGSTWRVKALYAKVDAPAGAGTGDHNLSFRQEGVNTTYAYSNFGDNVVFNASNWQKATGGQNPTDEQAVLTAVQSLRATPTKALKIRWQNNTDVTATADRLFTIIVEESSY